MLTKNWKSILNINNKSIVVISDNSNNSVAKNIKEYEEIIKEDNESYILFPEIVEILEKNKVEILKKYTPDFKLFLSKKDKKTLITHDIIFSTIVKEEKQKDFIELLLKNKKQIIIISEKKYESIDNLIYVVSLENWLESLNIIDKFKDINIMIKKIFNPFKDPKQAFLKYKEN